MWQLFWNWHSLISNNPQTDKPQSLGGALGRIEIGVVIVASDPPKPIF